MANEVWSNRAFRELEEQNTMVSHAFWVLRQNADHRIARELTDLTPAKPRGPGHESYHYADHRMPPGRYSFTDVLFSLLLPCFLILVLYLSAWIDRYVRPHWLPAFSALLDILLLPPTCAIIGARAILLVSRLDSAPLRDVRPPKADSDDPLLELKELAERTASRLQTAYRFQLSIVVIVGVILVGLIVWTMVMVNQQQILYASAFGSGSLAMMIMAKWKWQPFDRINEARRSAENADALATGLRLRMWAISEIEDPRERANAQWEAIEKYLARS